MASCSYFFIDLLFACTGPLDYSNSYKEQNKPLIYCPRPALVFLTTWATGCRIPWLLTAPSAVPVLQPIFSSIALPLFSLPSSGADAPTMSPSLYPTAALECPPPDLLEDALQELLPLRSMRGRRRRANVASIALNWLSTYDDVHEVRYSTGNRFRPLPADFDLRLKAFASSCTALRFALSRGGKARLDKKLKTTK